MKGMYLCILLELQLPDIASNDGCNIKCLFTLLMHCEAQKEKNNNVNIFLYVSGIAAVILSLMKIFIHHNNGRNKQHNIGLR